MCATAIRDVYRVTSAAFDVADARARLQARTTAEYRALMQGWINLDAALRAAAGAVVLAQAAIDAADGNVDQWMHAAGCALRVMSRIADALGDLGVELPAVLTDALRTVDSLGVGGDCDAT